jgi:hypothetical protein
LLVVLRKIVLNLSLLDQDCVIVNDLGYVVLATMMVGVDVASPSQFQLIRDR